MSDKQQDRGGFPRGKWKDLGDGSYAEYVALDPGSIGSTSGLALDATLTNGSQQVQGNAASASADTGNPIKIGGKYNSAAPTLTNGQRGDIQLDSRGNMKVALYIADNTAAPYYTTVGDGLIPGTQAPAVSAAFGFVFNGTTWDRQRGNFNTTTGDTGAKVANFVGATQTNFNARGAVVTAVLGAVSGTFTTFQTGIQWSPDGGTLWLPLTALGANITSPASGNTITWNIYPGIGTITPAASGGTAAGTQYNYANIVLPRTWRFAMTIAGTNPSITVTSVNVSYVV